MTEGVAALLVVLIAVGFASTGQARAASGLTAQPVLGMPASQVEVVGASPGEGNEVWAQGQIGAVPAQVGSQSVSNTAVLLRYTAAAGSWQVVPVDDASGNPIPITWQATEVTPARRSGAAGHRRRLQDDAGHARSRWRLRRRPQGDRRPAPGAVLLKGESLLPSSNIPTMAAIDEGGHAGVLVAPGGEDTTSPGVLHYVNGQWTREAICASAGSTGCTPPTDPLSVVAVSPPPGLTTPGCWRRAGTGNPPLLFERRTGSPGPPVWVQQQPSSWLFGASAAPIPGETASARRPAARS